MEGVLLDWARTVWYEVPSIISSNDNLKFLFIDLRRNVLHSSIAEAACFYYYRCRLYPSLARRQCNQILHTSIEDLHVIKSKYLYLGMLRSRKFTTRSNRTVNDTLTMISSLQMFGVSFVPRTSEEDCSALMSPIIHCSPERELNLCLSTTHWIKIDHPMAHLLAT